MNLRIVQRVMHCAVDQQAVVRRQRCREGLERGSAKARPCGPGRGIGRWRPVECQGGRAGPRKTPFKDRAQAPRQPAYGVRLSSGPKDIERYVADIAALTALPVYPGDAAGLRVPGDRPVREIAAATIAPPGGNGQHPHAVALDATAFDMARLNELARQQGAGRLYLTTPDTIRIAVLRQFSGAIVEEAAHGLARERPECSAKWGVKLWQLSALAIFSGLFVGGFAVASSAAVVAASLFLTLPFLAVVLLRTAALFLLPLHPARVPKSVHLPDDALPTYTILCPLYREAEVVGQLLHALCRLDYPAAKLDIKLILEAGDDATLARINSFILPRMFDVLVVPSLAPKTKPKALNFALQFARGALVVIYDAEDIPAPDQLRRAAGVFARSDGRLGCLQCRLMVHNGARCWLTRMFSIEYMSLFDGLLPAFQRLGLPLPLGGTSNHFPRVVLEAVGGWDAHNVTEDADLGMRLTRDGYDVRVLGSDTLEEAPTGLGNWTGQRTRWIKGWLQTFIVHNRRPLHLLSDLGLWGFLGFQAIVGGVLLSALVHPMLYLLVGAAYMQGELFAVAATPVGQVLVWVAAINIVAGYASAILLGVLVSLRRGQWVFGTLCPDYSALLVAHFAGCLSRGLAVCNRSVSLGKDPALCLSGSACTFRVRCCA